jgi:sterol desaturase/sphingolipid hydroxylase (fatty acid hydroxylase superfamily)
MWGSTFVSLKLPRLKLKMPALSVEALSPVIIATISAGILCFCIIPCENSWKNVFDRILPYSLEPYYSSRNANDRTATIMMAGAILGYIIMSALCFFLDLWSPIGWKTQGAKSYMNWKTTLYVVFTCLINMFVFSWVAMIPVWTVLHRGGLLRHEHQLLASFDEPLRPLDCIKNFLVHAIVIDVWFYSTHKILHWPGIYKAIHKLHHTYHAPTAVCCMYAHPLEFIVGNVFGVILGPALTNAHPYECAFWMCFSLVSTCGSHSGYYVFGAVDHDRHHEHLHCNYGVGVLMDRIFSTSYEGSELQRKIITREKENGKKIF